MMRIFKPRSPMNLGAWCLSAFSLTASGAVAADLLDRPRAAKALGGATALFGGYLGSYTGVLLAATAVPVWSRSRLFLGPIFVCTATAGGAALTRLTLVATGAVPSGHPTRRALGTVETGAMLAELVLSHVNKHRLGRLAIALDEGRPGTLFKAAEAAIVTGLSLRLGRKRLGVWEHNIASLLYLGAGLAFRFAWVEAGTHSATDHEAVARTARGKATVDDQVWDGAPPQTRMRSLRREPVRRSRNLYGEAIRRTSLAVEGLALKAGWKPGHGHVPDAATKTHHAEVVPRRH
jgi:formate-dependent nitrite reductase membrane component NrfD